MAVNVTQEEMDLLNQNGISQNAIKETVDNYREDGLTDEEIRAKIDLKLNSFKPIEVEEQPTKVIQGNVEKRVEYNPMYEDITKNNSLTKDQKIQAIKERGEEERKQIDRENAQKLSKIWGGGALSIGASALPFGGAMSLGGKIGTQLLKPVVGRAMGKAIGQGALTGLSSGAIEGIAQTMMNDEKGLDWVINPVKYGLGGLLGGSLLGAIGGKISKIKRGKELSKMPETPVTETQAIQPQMIQPQAIKPKATKKKISEKIKPINEEKKAEAWRILEEATGKNEKWLKMRFKKNNELIDNLLEKADQRMSPKYWSDDDFANEQIYYKGDYNESARRAFDDILNNNFYTEDFVVDNYFEDMANASKEEVNRYNQMLSDYFKTKDFAKAEAKFNELYPFATDEELAKFYEDIEFAEKSNAVRGGVKTLENKYGQDVSDQITNRYYETRGKEVLQKEAEKMSIEDKARLVNSDDTSDIAQHVKAEYLNNEVRNGNVPTSMLNKWVGEGTELGQSLQSRTGLEDFIHAVAKAQKNILDNAPKNAKYMLENASKLAEDINNTDSKNAIDKMFIKKITTKGNRKSFIDQLQKLKADNNLNADTFTELVNKRFKIQTLEKADIDEIKTMFDTIENATTQREKEIAQAIIKKKIASYKPAGVGRKISTIQAGAQLLNPKTIARNLVGNGLFGTAEDLTQSLIATPIDKLVSKVTGNRSVMPTNIGTQLKGMGQGLSEGLYDLGHGIDTSLQGSKFDLPLGQTFESPIGQLLDKVLNLSLRVPDRMAFQGVYNETLENLMRANGVKNITKEILEKAPQEFKDIAEQEALYRTFQDDNRISKASQDLKNALNGGKDFGLGDFVLKYSKTPANILARGLDYSPIGLLKGGKEVAWDLAKNPDFNQRKAVMDLARGLMGTGVMGAGTLLAMNNITGEDTDNQKLRANQMANGERPYSIRIGDKNYSYDWAVPMSMPFGAGANLNNGEDLLSSIFSSMDVLTEQPLLQGVKKVAGGYQDVPDAMLNTLIESPLSFVPALLRQTAQTKDPIYRETRDGRPIEVGNNIVLPANIRSVGNRIKANIPIVSETLPAKYDVTGEPVMREGGGMQAFVNPTNVSTAKDDIVLDEVIRLYEETGDSKNLLPSVKKSIKVNGEDVKLDNNQISEYQRQLGEATYSKLSDLFETNTYINADDDRRSELVQRAISMAKSDVESRLFGKKKRKNSLSKVENAIKKYDKLLLENLGD